MLAAFTVHVPVRTHVADRLTLAYSRGRLPALEQ